MRRVAIAAVALLANASAVWAHAMLEHASPGAGASLKQPPKVVTLGYSEALEPAFSAVTVTDANGRDVTAGPSSANGTAMRVPLKPLGPGRYRVTWHAVSVDTHRTQGAFSFDVMP